MRVAQVLKGRNPEVVLAELATSSFQVLGWQVQGIRRVHQ